MIAFTGDSDIYVMDVDGSSLARLTDHPERDGGPAWSPDGSKIAFGSGRNGIREIYVMNADGSELTRVMENTIPEWNWVWSPLVYSN